MPDQSCRLEIYEEGFAVAGKFVIARGARTRTEVVRVVLRSGDLVGQGESVPNVRYDESPSSVVAEIEAVRAEIEGGADRVALQELLEAGSARAALDAALWDLESRRLDQTALDQTGGRQAGRSWLQPVQSVITLSLDDPETMAQRARALVGVPVLKLKLGGDGLDLERVCAVEAAAPEAGLLVDANESWRPAEVERRLEELASHRVVLVEQPLPAADDAVLADFRHPIPLCADESCHTLDGLDQVAERYEVANLKLEKTGGLTHALLMRERLETLGLGLMVGCMLGTSLNIAPALVLAQTARFADLDGPYLLAEDRSQPLRLSATGMVGANEELWRSPPRPEGSS